MSPDHGPILNLQRKRLGERRLTEFLNGHGKLQAMAVFLVMSTMSVPQTGYEDDALEALKQDAHDLRDAANAWAETCLELADDWQAQRQEGTP